MNQSPSKQHYWNIGILCALFLILPVLKFSINFKGLNDLASMDQAQIARQLARGEGMTTKFIRPIDLATSSRTAKVKAQKETQKLNKQAQKSGQETASEPINVPVELNVHALPDTANAPLNIIANALALKLTGTDDFEDWKMPAGHHIYTPDRIIASVSLFFFLASIIVTYFLIARLFDASISIITCSLILLSDLFLQFSISGLPQMLMLFLFSTGMLFLFAAIEKKSRHSSFLTQLLLASVFFALVPLAGWVGIWIFIGFLIFAGIHFKPYGLYCLPAIFILLLFSSWSMYHNYTHTGSFFGIDIFSIYQGIVGSDENIMRALSQQDIPFHPRGMLALVAGNIQVQTTKLLMHMGGILVVPFFFLALFHPFKKQSVNSFKWSVFVIWICSAIGMALYSPSDSSLNSTQLQTLIAPLFTAFGLSILFVMLGRIISKRQDLKALKPLVIFAVILVSSGSFLLSIPQSLKVGLLTTQSGFPNWPPYLPLALNSSLHDNSSPEKVIASDQPWAVAWYADRTSMWLPRKKETFTALEDILKAHNSSISGLLISPVSHNTPGGLKNILAKYGDFAFFSMEGPWMATHNAYGQYLMKEMDANISDDIIFKRFAHSKSRIFLVGYDLIYYCETPDK